MPNKILGKVMLLPRGEYDPKVQYNHLDVVSYMGDGFIVKRDVIGVTPVDGDDYMLLCDNGIPADGEEGQVLARGASQTDTRWMAVATGEDAVAMLAELGFVEPLIDENSVLLDGNSVLL